MSQTTLIPKNAEKTPLSQADLEERRQRKRACLEEMKLTLQETGLFNINCSYLAKKHGFHQSAVNDWLKEMLKAIPMEQASSIAVAFQSTYHKILKETQKVIADKEKHTFNQRMQASKLLLEAMDKYTQFMEQYGYKEKVAEKLQVENRDYKFIIEVQKDEPVDITHESDNNNLETDKEATSGIEDTRRPQDN